jgi:hypothetical protein
MRIKPALGLAAATLLVGAVATGLALANTSGGGTAAQVEFKTGGAVSTPSGTFLTIVSDSFTANPGPIVVRFSAVGSEQDWNRSPAFVGRHYAAMRVRVLVNGAGLAPGASTFIDNRGVRADRTPRPIAAGYEWAGTIGSGGTQAVRVQIANLHTFDMANLNHWTLVIQHN